MFRNNTGIHLFFSKEFFEWSSSILLINYYGEITTCRNN